MQILEAVAILRPKTSWNWDPVNQQLTQIDDGSPVVVPPTLAQINALIVSEDLPQTITANQRLAAVNQLTTDPSANSKFIRAVLLTILDEINVIRALLPGPPAPRTVNQFRSAVQAKINGGAAD